MQKLRRQYEDRIVQLVTKIRARSFSYRTVEAYEQRVCRYIAFCGEASSEFMGADAVTGFFNELVVAGNVRASTRNHALNALVFLYKRVNVMPLGEPTMTSGPCKNCSGTRTWRRR